MLKTIASPKLLGALFVFGSASLLSAQLNSSAQTIAVTAQAPESISISITTGGPVNFPILGIGQASPGSVNPGWTTSWVLNANRTSVKVYAYFGSTTALTGANPMNTIPASDISGQANGGAQTAFTTGAVAPVSAGSGMLVSTTAITGANLTAMKSDKLNLFLTVPTGGVFANDTYTGSLFIQAQATP
jgi:hypothetical protein